MLSSFISVFSNEPTERSQVDTKAENDTLRMQIANVSML